MAKIFCQDVVKTGNKYIAKTVRKILPKLARKAIAKTGKERQNQEQKRVSWPET